MNNAAHVISFSDPINSFQGSLQTDNEPIRLSYHRGTHYNSLVNPYKATVGVGLGLPGFQPGQAEKNLMKEATRLSENVHLEQVSILVLEYCVEFGIERSPSTLHGISFFCLRVNIMCRFLMTRPPITMACNHGSRLALLGMHDS